MSILNFLGKKDDNPASTSTPNDGLNVTGATGPKDVSQNLFVAQAPTIVDRPAVLDASTDKVEPVIQIENNIEVLNKFLEQNLEKRGYDDALVNPDSTHLNQNIEALKNDLLRVIRKVKTHYEVHMREIDVHIETRSRSGMIDTVEELKMRRNTVESHIQLVLQIEESAKSGTGEGQGILISYEKGFKNGLSAISFHTILNRAI